MLEILLPALIPVVADGLRTAFRWFFGGDPAKPMNIDEVIRLMEAETRKLQVVAELDKPAGDISRWVADLRASFRYLAAALLLLSTVGTLFAVGAGFNIPKEFVETMLQISASVFSFLFGDRMYFHLRNGAKE